MAFVIVLLIIVIISLLVISIDIYGRLKKVEKTLRDIQVPPVKEKEPEPVNEVFSGINPEAIIPGVKSREPVLETVHDYKTVDAGHESPKEKKKERKISSFWTQFGNRFLENWIAIIGVAVLVVGITFLGIWAASRLEPLFRTGMIVGAAAVLFAFSFILRKKELFRKLCEWLRSASAAVYLFATIGAGGIPGLKWIENPFLGLLFLISGILFNIVLGLISLFMVPQSIITLVVGTVITFSGLAITFRKKWDFHHLFSLLFYFGYIIFWGLKVDTHETFYNLSAMAAILITGILTLSIHYRIIYNEKKFEVVPFLVHILNWFFIAFGLIKYASDFDYIALPLFSAAVILYFLARRAKRKNIFWLYYTDTFTAQLMAALAVIALLRLDVYFTLVLFILFMETLIFSFVVFKEKREIVHNISLIFLILSAFVLGFSAVIDSAEAEKKEAFLNFSYLIAACIFSGIYLHFIPGIPWIKGSDRTPSFKRSIMNIFGAVIPLLLFCAYLSSFLGKFVPDRISPVWPLVPFILFLLFLKFKIKNIGMSGGLIFYFAVSFIISIADYFSEYEGNMIDTLQYFGPIILTALAVVIYSYRQKGVFHKWLPGLYLFAVSFAFFTYFLFKKFSPLVIGMTWLGSSLVFLELPALLAKKKPEVIKNYLHAGYFFLLIFLVRFVFIDMQTEQLVFWVLKARICMEIFAAGVFIYWLLRKDQNYSANSVFFRKINPLMLELSGVFILFSLFIEIRQSYMASVLMVYALVLLIIGRFGPGEFSRLKLHSVFCVWLSSFYTAFVTSPYIIPSLHFYDETWFLGAAAVSLQIIYFILLHNLSRFEAQTLPELFSGMDKSLRFFIKRKNYFLYYPVFISTALFLIWSFDKSVLTLLLTLEVFTIFGLSILIRENHFRYLSMAGLLGCLIRLVLFDIRKTSTITKAVVCILVALLMLGMNLLYNKFKTRFEIKAASDEK